MAKQVVFNNRIEGEGHPIDLTREEFIHFQTLLSRISGPMRTRTTSLVASLVLAATVIGGQIMLWANGQEIDLLLLAAALLLTGFSLLLWCYVPVQLKRSAGKNYDRTVKSGISHYGLLRIAEHAVIKQKATMTATVSVGPHTFFIEDSVMQVFVTRGGQSIVLPARCMTPELAEEARRVAQQLPQSNYRFFSRLQAAGQPVTPPPETTTAMVLLDETVQYTTEEYVPITKALAVQHFWARAPLYCVISMGLGLLLGWNGESILPSVVWFFVIGGLLALLNVVLPLRRFPRLVEAMSANDLTIHVVVDDRGVRIRKGTQGEIGLPWEAITHVYDGATMVEVTGKGQFIRIPKRCIEDFEVFSQDIDTYLHKK